MSRQKQKQNIGTTEKATPVLESSSATEPETSDEAPATLVNALQHQAVPGDTGLESEHDKQVDPASRTSNARAIGVGSSSDSSQPRRASKKAKPNAVPEDSDTDGNETSHKIIVRPSNRPPSIVRGARVRQPIKRGGRRF